jgi:hypothetical protein
VLSIVLGLLIATTVVPAQYVDLFHAVSAERGDGCVALPFPIWREAFINDADLETALHTYGVLNPHPLNTTAS